MEAVEIDKIDPEIGTFLMRHFNHAAVVHSGATVVFILAMHFTGSATNTVFYILND